MPDTPSVAPTYDFAGRRARVLDALGDEGAMVLPAAPEIIIGRDTELRYVVDPDLWYLTGYREPEGVAVLAPQGDAPFTLFVRPRDPDRETWTGPRGGLEAATQRFGADAAANTAIVRAALAERLAEILGYQVHEIRENDSVVDWLFERVHLEEEGLEGAALHLRSSRPVANRYPRCRQR